MGNTGSIFYSKFGKSATYQEDAQKNVQERGKRRMIYLLSYLRILSPPHMRLK